MPNKYSYLVVSRGDNDRGTFVESATDFEVVGGVLYVSDETRTVAAFSEWVSIQEVEDE